MTLWFKISHLNYSQRVIFKITSLQKEGFKIAGNLERLFYVCRSVKDLEVRQSQVWVSVSGLLLAAVQQPRKLFFRGHNIRSNTVIRIADPVLKANTPRVKLPSPALRPDRQVA